MSAAQHDEGEEREQLHADPEDNNGAAADAVPMRKKSKKASGPQKTQSAPASSSSSSSRSKSIHEHSFILNQQDQSQKCSQCGFVVEFESF
jgi:hypothetical protein